MIKLTAEQKQQLLRMSNCVFHIAVYKGNLIKGGYRVNIAVLTDDEGVKTEEDVKAKILEESTDINDLEIGIGIVTNSVDEVERIYNKFHELAHKMKERKKIKNKASEAFEIMKHLKTSHSLN